MRNIFVILLYCCFLLPVSSWAQQFSGSGGSIPDAGPRTCFSIPVDAVGLINGAYGLSSVCINIRHSWTADLEIILRSPDGTEVPLSVQNGGSGANYLGTCFTSSATIPVSSGTAPFTGSYLPQGYLGNFNNGQNADGNWELCIRDLTASDVGALLSWSLTFSNAPAPPRPACLNPVTAGADCTTAPLICNFNGLCGTTGPASSNVWPELSAAFCGSELENTSFLKFIASSSSASFNVWVTNSFNALGIEMMIFEGECNGVVAVKGCNNRIFPSSSTPTLVTASNLTPGNTYYILIDGYQGDICDYLIVAASGVNFLKVLPVNPQLCPGDSVALNVVGGGGNYTWTPAEGLNTTIGADVIAHPETTVTYTVQSNSTSLCPLIASVTVQVNAAPEFGPDRTISICNGTSINLPLQFNTAGLTTFLTQGGVPVANPSAVSTSGLYQLVGRNVNRCSDTVQITLANVVKPNLGLDKLVSICPGDSINLNLLFNVGTFATRWTLRGNLINNANAVRAPGVYQVIAFNGSDCTDTANVTVFLNAAPYLGQDKNVNLCEGNVVNLTSLFNTTGYSTAWSTGGVVVGNVTAIQPTGTYQLVATNSSGCTDTALVNVRQVEAIRLGADKQMLLCAGDSVVLDTIYNIAGITANWTLGNTNVNQFLPTTVPGTYELIAVNGVRCRDTAYFTLVNVPKPSVGPNKAVGLCAGSQVNLNSLFALNGLHVSWYLDTMLVTNPVIENSGVYQLIVQDDNGCRDTALADVVIRLKPSIGQDTTVKVCPYVPVNLNNYVKAFGLTVAWTRNGLAVANPSGTTTAGVYRCIATNIFGCSDTAFVTLVLLNKPNLGPDKTVPICSGRSVNLSTLFNIGGLSSTWTFGGTPLNGPAPILVSAPGAYRLIVTNSVSCTDTAIASLFLSPVKLIGPDTTASLCFGATVNLNGFVDTAGVAVMWSYYGFDVPRPDSVRGAGIYRAVGRTPAGCTDTAYVVLDLYPRPNLGPDKELGKCIGSIFNLTTQFNTTGNSYVWLYSNTPVPDPTAVTAPGVYQLVVENPGGCKDTAQLTLVTTNILNLGNDTLLGICNSKSVNLNTIYPTSGLTAGWTVGGNAVANTTAVNIPGIYQIIATNGIDCVDTARVTLINANNPNLGPDKVGFICEYNSYDLTTSFTTGTMQTNWYLNANPVTRPDAVISPGVYKLVGTDSVGCTDTALITLSITPNPSIGDFRSIERCAGDPYNLIARFSSLGLSQDWYYNGPLNLDPPVSVPNPTAVTIGGFYTLIASNNYGCKDTSLLKLVMSEKPNLGADRTTGFCPGKSVDLTELFGAEYLRYRTVVWTLNETVISNPTSISLPGIYRLRAAYGGGCFDTCFVTVVRYNKPVLGSDRNVSLCPGTSVGLDAQFNLTGLQSNWTFNGLPVANPTGVFTPGTYTLEAKNINGCADTANVHIAPLPQPELGPDKKINLCDGLSINLYLQFDTVGLNTAYTFGNLPVINPAVVFNPGSYQLIAGNASGCRDTAIVTISRVAKPSFGADKSIAICPGQAVNLFNQFDTTGLAVSWQFQSVLVADPAAVSTAGIYELTGSNFNGCRDTALLILIVKPVTYGTDSISICSNQLPLFWNGGNYATQGTYSTVLQNAAGCDSIVTLVLAVADTSTSISNIRVCRNQLPLAWNGLQLIADGLYSVRLVNASGCDSIAVVNFSVADTSFSITKAAACIDQLPYSWNGLNLETSGSYAVTLSNAGGCDSIAVIQFAVLDTSVAYIEATTCSNQLPYVWNSLICPAAGTYTARLTNAVGCDSVVTLQLKVKEVSFSQTSVTVCNNQLPFVWNGSSFSAAGSYTVLLVNAAGCDSVANLQLTVEDTSISIETVTVCNNQLPYPWNGNTYLVSGNYTIRLTNAAGCDSVLLLHLTVADTSISNTTINLCSNRFPFEWNNTSFAGPGNYAVTLVNATGCDSIARLQLNLVDTTISLDTIQVCSNQLPFVWNSITCNSAGNYQVELTNAVGCDSVAYLHLLVNDTSFSTTSVNVCNSQLPYRWNNNDYATAGNYSVRLINAAGCDSIANLLLTVTDTSSYEIAVTVCNNQLPYQWNGNNYSASGDYRIRLANAAGCDSVLLLRLTVADSSLSTTTVNLCSNRFPFEWNNSMFTGPGNYTVTLVNAAGCDSIARLQLNLVDTTTSFDTARVCNNQLPFVWNSLSCNSAGNYQVQLTNAAGCDSVAYLHLLVSDTSFSTTSVNVCSNQLPYRWNSNNYATAGTYTVRLINAAGCDSVANLQLTVTDTSFYEEAVTVCNNQLPYVWNGNPYVVSGNYAVQLVNAGGCDSIVRLRLTIADSTVSSTEVNLCSNQFPYRWNNNTYVQPGDYKVLLVNAGGCDSIAHLRLNRIDTTVSFDTVRLCNNQLPYLWNGISLAANGDYQQRLLNANGCDSVAYLHLVVSDTSFSSTTAVVCNNQLPYRWNNNAYSLAGDYSIRLVNAVGCDSIAKLRLIINDSSVSHTYITRCDVQGPYTWNGQSYTSSGVYSYLGTNQAGCDSLAWLHLTVNGSTASSTNIDTCENSLPFTWNGLNCTAAGIYRVVLQNAAGCDSVCTLTLTVKRNTSSISIDSVCRNQLPYRWNNNTYTATGSYQVLLTNAAGCDSIATLQLFVKDTSESSTRITRCRNQLPYRWNGTELIASGIYQHRFVNSVGCDSVAKLEFVVLDTSTSLTNVSVCSNQLPYEWNGNSYPAAGSYSVRLQNAAGCDSVATLQLTVKRTSTSVTTESICPSALPFSWNGAVYAAAGTYQRILVNAAGCDSIAELRLSVKANSTSDTTVRICENNLPYVWNGTSYNQAGRYTKSFVNAAGCDSIAVLNVVVLRNTYATIRKSLCTNDLPYSWNGNTYSAAGTYNATLVNAAGCDSLVTLELAVNPNPVKPILGADTLICPGDKLLLNPGNYYAYFWQNRSTTPTIEAQQAGVYTVRVGNEFGCYSFASRNIGLLNDCDDIYFANAFSPNGDGKNETFGPLGNLFVVSKYNFTIFNRYGKVVFATNNPYQKWNGQINGAAAPAGNYIWKAVYQYRSKLNQARTGNVVLLR